MISLSIFLKIFVPVFIVVIYPGPCVLSYGNIAMNYGYKKGYAGVLGCFTVEFIYWLICIFALNSAKSALSPFATNLLAIFAGLFLMYMAYDFLRTDTSKLNVPNIKNNSLAIYLKFLLITASNPIAIIGYAGIYMAIDNIKEHAVAILISSVVASLTAHSIVVLCSGTLGKVLLKSKSNGKIFRIINILSAICISGYALIEVLIPTIKSIIKTM